MKVRNLVFVLACVILVVNTNGFKTKNRGRKVGGTTISYLASVSFRPYLYYILTH